MRRAWLLAACLFAGSAGAQTCEQPPLGAARAESPRFVLHYKPEPAIVLNKHFGLRVLVCPKAPVAGPLQLRVDARMPAHQHGMNYKPTIAATAPGQYKADGLLFHMPGRWELMFEVEAAGRSDKLAARVDL